MATENIHQLKPLDLQINGTSHFTNDLGLDSLDTVEVVMAIEEVRAPVSLGKASIASCMVDI